MRCRTANLQEEIVSLHNQMFALSYDKAKKLVDNYFISRKDFWIDHLKKNNEEFIEKNADFFPYYFAMIAFKRASEQNYINIFDVDCSFNLFIQGEWTYIIPYGSYSIIENIQESDTLVHYPYFNNTDEPEEVSQENWDKRKEEWDCATNLEKFYKNRIYHDVINLKERIGFYKLLDSLYGENSSIIMDKKENNEAMKELGLEHFKGH